MQLLELPRIRSVHHFLAKVRLREPPPLQSVGDWFRFDGLQWSLWIWRRYWFYSAGIDGKHMTACAVTAGKLPELKTA